MNPSKTRTIGQYRCRNLRYSGKKLRWLSFCSDLTTYFVACACARVHGCEKTSRDVWSCEHENRLATAFSLGSAAFAQKQPVVKINGDLFSRPSYPGLMLKFLSDVLHLYKHNPAALPCLAPPGSLLARRCPEPNSVYATILSRAPLVMKAA